MTIQPSQINTFSNGSVADADKVNQDFNVIVDEINNLEAQGADKNDLSKILYWASV